MTPSIVNVADEIVEALARRVRCLSVGQIVRTWDVGGDVNTLLHILENDGLIERQRMLARSVSVLEAPIVSWRPGMATPSFGSIAYRLKTRWSPAEPTEVVVATKRAASRLGGSLGGRWPRAAEVSHDVNLAEVFLRFREERPAEAAAWVPEAQLYAEGMGRVRGARLPDAVIRTGGALELAVEFGGAYSKQKLVAFHAEMSAVPYEIW